MKKITILLFLLTIVLRGMGQTAGLSYSNLKAIPASKNAYNSLYHSGANASNRSSAAEGWVSYADTIQAVNGTNGQLYIEAMFPDSDVVISFGTDVNSDTIWGTIFEHGIANTFNAYSSYFNLHLSKDSGYTLDSVDVGITYTRHTDASVVDTLVFNVFQGTYATNAFPPYAFAPDTYWAHHFDGYDTVAFPGIYYDYTSFGPLKAYYNGLTPPSTVTTIRLPLQESDSSFTKNLRAVAIPGGGMKVAAGNLVAATVAFKPGYVWHPFDTISRIANVASFFSLDEELASGEPTYLPKDNNVSFFDPNEVQYNLSLRKSGGWDTLYIPTYAYAPGYQLQDNYFQYHIKYNTAGIQTVSGIVTKQSIYPNPASDITMVSYTLKTGASVVINVYDITGNLIRSFNEGNLTAGVNQKLINTQDLSDGVYLVSIEANGAKSFSKLVVSK